MSDAKAKAEARRAKILARDSSKRMVSAIVPGEEDDALYANLGEIKGKDRPIAARRNLIKSSSQLDIDADGEAAPSEPATPKEKEDNNTTNNEDGSATSPVKKEEKSVEESATTKEGKKRSDEVVDTPAKEVSEVAAASSSSSTAEKMEKNEESTDSAKKPVALSPKSSSVKLPPPKTMEEIEREVAENTAKFDRNMSYRSTSTKLTPERVAQLEQLAKRKTSGSVDPSNLMRLVRFLVIGLLAAYTGYRTAEVSRLEALQPSKLVEIQTVKEMDEFGNVVAEVPVASGDFIKKDPSVGRTWVGYVQDQYTRRSECTVTAVMLAWWVAGLFKRFINNSPKQQKGKPNIIEQLYNYVNGFQEAALATVGEFAWHLFALVLTVTCHSLYYSHLALQQGNDAAAGNVCVAGGDTSSCPMSTASVASEL